MSPARMVLGLLLAAACVHATPATAAGHMVDQKVALDADKTTCDYTWRMTEREFRLDVKCVDDVRSFVFNGRVLYVCGKLGKAQIDFVKTLKIPDRTLSADLAKGVCQ